MKKFTIYYDYVMCGEVVVEADSLDEAIDKLEHDCDIPIRNINKDIYVDGSFEVNISLTKEVANKEVK